MSNRQAPIPIVAPTPTLRQAVTEIETALKSHTPPSTDNAFGLALKQIVRGLNTLTDTNQSPPASFHASLPVLFNDTIGTLYHPTCPFASLVMKTTAALIRHIFTIELPRVWDKELVKKNRRGGRGFITDMREKGEQWEAVILAVLQGLIEHIERNDLGLKDQHYRTMIGEHFFSAILNLVFSEDAWRLPAEIQFKALEVVGGSISKHQANKVLVNSFVTFRQFDELMAENSDRILSLLIFEITYRAALNLISKSDFAKALFTKELFGDLAPVLQTECIAITVGNFFARAEKLLDMIGKVDITRSQTITGHSMTSDKTTQFIEAEPIPIWLCRDMIATVIDVAAPGSDDADDTRVYVWYETIERVELTRIQDMMCATFNFNSTVQLMRKSATQVIPADPGDKNYQLEILFPLEQEILFRSTMKQRSKLYKKLSIKLPSQFDAPNVAWFPARKASQSAAIEGTLLHPPNIAQPVEKNDNRRSTSTFERAGHLADISEVNLDTESSRSESISGDSNTNGEALAGMSKQGKAVETNKEETEVIKEATKLAKAVSKHSKSVQPPNKSERIEPASRIDLILEPNQLHRQLTVDPKLIILPAAIGSDSHQNSHKNKEDDDDLSSDLSSLEASEDEADRNIRRLDRKRTKSLHRARANLLNDLNNEPNSLDAQILPTSASGLYGNVPESPTNKRLISDVSSEGAMGGESNNAHDSQLRAAKRFRPAPAMIPVPGVKKVESKRKSNQRKKSEVVRAPSIVPESDGSEGENSDGLNDRAATLEEKRELVQAKKKYGATKLTLAELGSAKKGKAVKKVDGNADEDAHDAATLWKSKPIEGLRKPKGGASAKSTKIASTSTSKKAAVEKVDHLKKTSKSPKKPFDQDDDSMWDEFASKPAAPLLPILASTSKTTGKKKAVEAVKKSTKTIKSFNDLVNSDPKTTGVASRTRQSRESQSAVAQVEASREVVDETDELASLPVRHQQHQQPNDVSSKSDSLKKKQQKKKAIAVVGRSSPILDDHSPVAEHFAFAVAPADIHSASANDRSSKNAKRDETKTGKVERVTESRPAEKFEMDRRSSRHFKDHQTLQQELYDAEDAAMEDGDQQDGVIPDSQPGIRNRQEPQHPAKNVSNPTQAQAQAALHIVSLQRSLSFVAAHEDHLVVSAVQQDRATLVEHDKGMNLKEVEVHEKANNIDEGKGRARDSGVGIIDRRMTLAPDIAMRMNDLEESDVDLVPDINRINLDHRHRVTTEVPAPIKGTRSRGPFVLNPLPQIKNQHPQGKPPKILAVSSSLPSNSQQLSSSTAQQTRNHLPTIIQPNGLFSFAPPPLDPTLNRGRKSHHSRRGLSKSHLPQLFDSPGRSHHHSSKQYRRESQLSRASPRHAPVLEDLDADNVAQHDWIDEAEVPDDADQIEELANTFKAFSSVLLTKARARKLEKDTYFMTSQNYINNQVKIIAMAAAEESAVIISETDKRLDAIRQRNDKIRASHALASYRSDILMAKIAKDFGVACLADCKPRLCV